MTGVRYAKYQRCVTLDKMENTCSNLPVEQLVGLNLFCIFAILVIFFFQQGILAVPMVLFGCLSDRRRYS